MPKSSSRPSQQQQTQNTSNQINVSDQGFALAGNNNTIVRTDHGAIEKAFDFGDKTLEFAAQNNQDAFAFAGGAFNRAIDTVESSVGAVERAAEDSLTFAAGAFNQALGFVGEVGQAGVSTTEDALSYSAGAFDRALNSVDRANTEALVFGSGAIDELADAREDSLEFAAGTLQLGTSNLNSALQYTERAQTEANLLANKGIGAAEKAFNTGLASNERTTNNALTFGAGAFNTAIDAISENAERQQLLVTQFADKTIQTAVNSTKTEAAQTIDRVLDLTGDTQKNVIYLGLGVLVVAAIMRS